MDAGRLLCRIGAPPIATSSSTPTAARLSSDPRFASPTAAGRNTGPCQAGRGAADERLPPRRRAPRQRRRRHAHDPAQRDPGVASVTNPKPAYGGVDPESLESARQRARDGDPHPLPRGHRRGLRVPGRRGVLAGRPDASASRRPRPTDAIRVHVMPRVAPGRSPAHLRGADPRRRALSESRRVPRRATA